MPRTQRRTASPSSLVPRPSSSSARHPGAVLALLLVLAQSAAAQTRQVEIVNADRVEVSTDSLDGTVRRLSGDVRLRQDTTALRADRAVQFVDRNQVELTGAVRIVSGTDTLTADRVLYDSLAKTARATGRVRVGDGTSTLFAPTVTYSSRDEISTFADGGRILHEGAVITSPSGRYSSAQRRARLDGPLTITDSAGVATADRGDYDARLQRLDLAGAVHLERELEALDADSLVYFRRTERARAFGQVVLERRELQDSTATDSVAGGAAARRAFLFGERLAFDGKAETAAMRSPDAARDPLLVVFDTDADGATDTTFARAPRLDATREIRPSAAPGVAADTLQVLTAAGGARLRRPDLGAVADSVRFVREVPGLAEGADSTAQAAPTRDRLALFGAAPPRVWADGAQISGDTLRASGRGGDVDSLRVLGRAFLVRPDSVTARLNQIRGGQMLARLRDGQVWRLAVWPTAEALYFRADEQGALAGADRVSADSLAFRFADPGAPGQAGDLREVAGFGGVAGTAYPARAVPPDLALPGLAYAPDDEPTPASLLAPDDWERRWLDAFIAPTPRSPAPALSSEPDAAPSASDGPAPRAVAPSSTPPPDASPDPAPPSDGGADVE